MYNRRNRAEGANGLTFLDETRDGYELGILGDGDAEQGRLSCLGANPQDSRSVLAQTSPAAGKIYIE